MNPVPCIVCGGRKRHKPAAHDTYRRESYRARNLQRKSWPKLLGRGAVLAYYQAKEKPTPPAPPSDTPTPADWWARVLPDGKVVHLPVYKDGEAPPDAARTPSVSQLEAILDTQRVDTTPAPRGTLRTPRTWAQTRKKGKRSGGRRTKRTP